MIWAEYSLFKYSDPLDYFLGTYCGTLLVFGLDGGFWDIELEESYAELVEDL